MARSLSIVLSALLSSGCCITGDHGTDTPLGAPIESDHAVASATLTMIRGSSFQRGSNDFAVDVENADGTPAVLVHVTATILLTDTALFRPRSSRSVPAAIASTLPTSRCLAVG